MYSVLFLKFLLDHAAKTQQTQDEFPSDFYWKESIKKHDVLNLKQICCFF